MEMIEAFDGIGQAIVRQYYEIMDSSVENRAQIVNLYHPHACITFEDYKGMGHESIKDILMNKAKFTRIQHIVTTIDCQPLGADGIAIQVVGQLKTDDDHPHSFSQNFIVKKENNSYFITNDIFRLSLHNTF